MKRHAKKILEHMMGPTGSIIIHVIIVIALVKLVYFATAPKDREVEVMMVDPETIDLDEIKEELKELEFEQMLNELAPPDMTMDMEMPDVAEVQEFSEVNETDFSELDVVDNVRSPLVIRGLYANRGAAGRKAALGAHGGSATTERAVLLALEWLRKNQLEDGSWSNARGNAGTDKRTGYTGLGLLAFLAHGETPGSERYGATVEKAIRFLRDNQQEDGAIGSITSDSGHSVYGHAIATYAISEAYAMTRIPTLKTTMDRAIELIVNGQQSGGGWNYGFKKDARRDTSIGGWCLQAMKAASGAGCSVAGLKESMDKGLVDFRKAQTEDGYFGYTDPARNINNTGIAVLCFQLMGQGDEAACKKGVVALDTAGVDWDDAAPWALYGWYYITQAKFHEGGSDWSKWNREFSRAFVRNQNTDGSWDSPGTHEESHGKAYATSLAALTLQVYYRHLPTYQREEKVDTEMAGDEEEDEEELIEII